MERKVREGGCACRALGQGLAGARVPGGGLWRIAGRACRAQTAQPGGFAARLRAMVQAPSQFLVFSSLGHQQACFMGKESPPFSPAHSILVQKNFAFFCLISFWKMLQRTLKTPRLSLGDSRKLHKMDSRNLKITDSRKLYYSLV